MATNIPPTVPATRNQYYQQHGQVSIAVNFADTTLANGVPLSGAIPAGSLITSTLILIGTAFNAGTTNPLQVGTTPLGADVVAATDSLSGAAGAKRPDRGTLLGRLAADTVLYANYVPTGTPATAGSGEIIVSFLGPAR